MEPGGKKGRPEAAVGLQNFVLGSWNAAQLLPRLAGSHRL